MSSSNTTIWVTSAVSLTLFLTLCYAASASAAWPRARPRVPLWFFLLLVLFPPFFPFLLLFLFLVPPPPYVVADEEIGRATRVVVVQQRVAAPVPRMGRI